MKAAKPKLRPVLLDATFVQALIATDSAHHPAAVALYETLVDRYEAGLDRLFALSTVLGDVPREFRRNALAPVLIVRVARQHRSAAAKITSTASADAALSLVMMRRERIRTVATTTHEYDSVDIDVIDIAGDGTTMTAADLPLGEAPYEADGVAAQDRAAVSSRTEPLPAPQSMAE